jgi:hypothetical protein
LGLAVVVKPHTVVCRRRVSRRRRRDGDIHTRSVVAVVFTQLDGDVAPGSASQGLAGGAVVAAVAVGGQDVGHNLEHKTATVIDRGGCLVARPADDAHGECGVEGRILLRRQPVAIGGFDRQQVARPEDDASGEPPVVRGVINRRLVNVVHGEVEGAIDDTGVPGEIEPAVAIVDALEPRSRCKMPGLLPLRRTGLPLKGHV